MGFQPIIRAFSGSRPVPSRRLTIARLARYATTSVVAFGVSEVTLLVLYGRGVTGATVAAVVANLVATIPSYLMSRYWIWSEAPRARAGRQMAWYWITSVVCIAGTSLSTGAIAGLVPTGMRFHLVAVGAGFLAVNIVFWVAKFVVYQRVIFPVDKPEVEAGAVTRGLVTGRLGAGLPVSGARRSRRLLGGRQLEECWCPQDHEGEPEHDRRILHLVTSTVVKSLATTTEPPK